MATRKHLVIDDSSGLFSPEAMRQMLADTAKAAQNLEITEDPEELKAIARGEKPGIIIGDDLTLEKLRSGK